MAACASPTVGGLRGSANPTILQAGPRLPLTRGHIMTVSSPKEEEFEWRGKKLVHKPSGANWTVTDDAVAYEASKLGGKGEAEHGVDEVIEMGKRLVEKGPPK
jgi:hypothetical protein